MERRFAHVIDPVTWIERKGSGRIANHIALGRSTAGRGVLESPCQRCSPTPQSRKWGSIHQIDPGVSEAWTRGSSRPRPPPSSPIASPKADSRAKSRRPGGRYCIAVSSLEGGRCLSIRGICFRPLYCTALKEKPWGTRPMSPLRRGNHEKPIQFSQERQPDTITPPPRQAMLRKHGRRIGRPSAQSGDYRAHRFEREVFGGLFRHQPRRQEEYVLRVAPPGLAATFYGPHDAADHRSIAGCWPTRFVPPILAADFMQPD